MVQWLRIRLPVQGTWVCFLVQEDPTSRGAAEPASHNYLARTPQLLKPVHSRARVLQLLKPVRLELVFHKRSHRNEKPALQNEE